MYVQYVCVSVCAWSRVCMSHTLVWFVTLLAKENAFQGLALKKLDRFHLETLASLTLERRQNSETQAFGFSSEYAKPSPL